MQQYSSWIQISTHARAPWFTKERNQKVGNSIPGQYVTQTWDAWCLSTMEGKLQAFLHPSWWEFYSQSTAGFLDSSEISGGFNSSTTLVSWDKWISTHPGMPFVASNQAFTSNKTFVSWTLINSDNKLAVSGSWNPGTSVLTWEGAVLTWHWWVLTDSAAFKHSRLNKYATVSATRWLSVNK